MKNYILLDFLGTRSLLKIFCCFRVEIILLTWSWVRCILRTFLHRRLLCSRLRFLVQFLLPNYLHSRLFAFSYRRRYQPVSPSFDRTEWVKWKTSKIFLWKIRTSAFAIFSSLDSCPVVQSIATSTWVRRLRTTTMNKKTNEHSLNFMMNLATWSGFP